MKKLFPIFAMSALMLVALGCDKIDDPHKPYVPMGGNKTVLIKDFTGVRCVNCPEAAETVHELQHSLGEDRIFILSVHAGFLAMPTGGFPDFRTEEGTAWYGDNNSNPLFSVDHVALTEGNTLYVEQIDTPLSDGLAEAQTFDIEIIPSYDETTRKLSIESKVVATADSDGQMYVTVCMVEDSIVGRQIVPGGADENYVFRNVFRGTVNGLDGELLTNNPIFVNDEFKLRHNIDLNEDFNADQCYVMTYVYEKTNGKILQTAMMKIK